MRQMVRPRPAYLPGVLDGLELESADVRRIAIAESKKPNCLVLDMSGVTMTGVADLATLPACCRSQDGRSSRKTGEAILAGDVGTGAYTRHQGRPKRRSRRHPRLDAGSQQ